MNWFYWVSIILMWIATGLNVYALIRSRRSWKNVERMYHSYERLRDEYVKRLNMLGINVDGKD